MIIGIVLVIVVVVAGYYLYETIASREALKECEVTLKGVEVKSVGISSATLELTFSVRNKGSHEATLDRLEYSIYGNNYFVGDGSTSQSFRIPVGSTKDVETEFNFTYIGTAEVIQEAIQKVIQDNTVSWRIKGTAFVEFFGAEIQVPFDIVV